MRLTSHVVWPLTCANMGLVPEIWLESDNLEEASHLVQAARAAYEALDEAESALAIVCDIGFASQVDDESLIHFRTDERVDLQRADRRCLFGGDRTRICRGHYFTGDIGTTQKRTRRSLIAKLMATDGARA